MNSSIVRRFVATIALVFALAVVGAPAALAGNGSNGPNGSNGSGTPTTDDTTDTTGNTLDTTDVGTSGLPNTGSDFMLPLVGGAALVSMAFGARHLARQRV